MSVGVFPLNVVHVADCDEFAVQFLRECNGKQVERFLSGNSVIANRKIQMIVVKNFIEGFDVSFCLCITACGHIESYRGSL